MTFVEKLKLLLPPAKRLEALLLLASVLIFAWIEVGWVAAIYWMVSTAGDVLGNPDRLTSYRILNVLSDALGTTDARTLLQVAGVATIGIVLLRNSWGVLVTWQRSNFVKTAEALTMSRLLRTYVYHPYQFFLDRNTAALSKNILLEAQVLISVSILGIINIVIDAATCVALVIYLLIERPLITISAAATFAAVLAGLYLFLRARTKTLGVVSRNAEEGMFRATSEALSGIKDVKILGRENYFIEKFTNHADTRARLSIENSILKEAPRYGVEALAFVAIIATLLFVIGAGSGLLEMTALLVLYGVAGFRLIPAMFRIYNSGSSINFSSAAFDAITGDLAGSTPGGTERRGERRAFPSLTKSIAFENLRFRYPGTDRDVIAGLDVSIGANESVAFVGATGAGKTTLVDIVLGLLSPTSGAIAVDGVPIDDTTVDAWRSQVGYVPQSIFLADAGIAANIAFGEEASAISRERLIEAAQTAHLHDFVMSLPAQYETGVGERGVRLSGGQRQRIGIARALYRRPRVLVLDEATSALDGITENIISDAIRELHGSLTMIIIAHRLSTVRHCDRIYLMERGQIVDQGSYDELIARNSTFRAMAGGAHA